MDSANSCFIRCKGEDKVIQEQGDVIAAEGDTVTLDCKYETSDSSPYLFWYKQEVNSYPNYMLHCLSTSTVKAEEFNNDRFDAKINKAEKSVPLKIQKLQLSDSAVYYCAVRPTTTVPKRLCVGELPGLRSKVGKHHPNVLRPVSSFIH
uniref:Ig-like domain-containing protein n=1 Tax=Maylandia zebra TaxID=106582 RepID=A0A3P9CDU6_9CICH